MKKIIIAILIATLASCSIPRGGHAQGLFQVDSIKVLSIKRNIRIDIHPVFAIPVPTGYIEITARFKLPLPTSLALNPNLAKIADSYKDMYGIDRIDTIGGSMFAVFIAAIPPLNIYKIDSNQITTTELIDEIDVQQAIFNEYNVYAYRFGLFQLFPFDAIIGKSYINGQWIYSNEN
jgi:hypothetical protein